MSQAGPVHITGWWGQWVPLMMVIIQRGKKGHSTGAEAIREDFLEEATGRQKGTSRANLGQSLEEGKAGCVWG